MTERLMHEDEIAALINRFGEPYHQHHTIEVSRQSFDHWKRKISVGPVSCRGEVIMVIIRPNGNVLLHTKDFYPPGAYRLPTGRVLWPDKVEATLSREVKEETNLEVAVERFLGLIEYEILCEGHSLPFVSYVFQLREVSGELRCLDDEEGICGFREAPVQHLPEVGAYLEQLKQQWRDWGHFRAVAHYAVEAMLGD